MTLAQHMTSIGERLPWPDVITRAAIKRMVGQTERRLLSAPTGTSAAFAASMDDYPIAIHTAAANIQHYEVPSDFFKLVLGPRLKYSSALFPSPAASLAEAEEIALSKTVENALLDDGQHVLELGCGWGSLSLWMAEHFPKARITAVSNSVLQRRYIEAEARTRNLDNLIVVTSDMNSFDTLEKFDRIVSVEMFEHMSNWPALLARARTWLRPYGRMLVHVFTHHSVPYRFDHENPEDWIAAHFFTGGIMPSHDLMKYCNRDFGIEAEWQWSGDNYQRTANFWLANFDRRLDEIDEVLIRTYGKDAALWRRRWRLFFLATAGLFGYGGGRCWGISQYRLRPVSN